MPAAPPFPSTAPVVGLSLRRPWIDDLHRTPDAVDFLEVYAENFWWRGPGARRKLTALRAKIPMTSHGMSVPLCGVDDPPAEALDAMAAFLDALDAPWWSEHLGIAHHGGENLHDILPTPMSPAHARTIARRAQAAQDRVGRPLLLEHGAAYFPAPGTTLDEPAFLRQLFEQCDARLLLDVNNLYVNAQNQGFDPRAWLDDAPLDRVAEIHLAGFTVSPSLGVLIDSHATAPPPPVWRLLDEALARTGPKPVLLEWESHHPDLAGTRPWLDRARAALRAVASPEAP